MSVVDKPRRLKWQHDLFLTQILTGHGAFGQFLHHIGARQTDRCPCGLGSQSVRHLLYDCLLTSSVTRFLYKECLTLGIPMSKPDKMLESQELMRTLLFVAKTMIETPGKATNNMTHVFAETSDTNIQSAQVTKTHTLRFFYG